MKIKIENLKESQRIIRIEVEPERVDSALNDAYTSIQKKANIPGYREGKAPRDLIEAHYSKTANEEALNRLIWDCYREAVSEQSIDPISYPVIEDVKFDKGSPLSFSVKVDVRPEFKLKNYKGIKIKEKPHEVRDEELDKALKDVQESMAQYKNLDARPIAIGDYVVCEYECFADGKSVDKNDKLWLYINDELQPKELLNALTGAEIGTVKEVDVTYPKDYQYKELAGQKRLYRVKPVQIQEKSVPEINDDLAKNTGHFKNLDELKERIRDNISGTKKAQARNDLEEQIFSHLLKNHSFEVPSSIVERQQARLVEETKQRLLQQGYKKEDIDKEEARLKDGLKEKARNNVRIFFIISIIAKEEKIEIGDEELKERIEEISKSTKQDLDKVRKELEDKNLLENLKEGLLHDKVVEFLLKEAKR